MNSSTTRFKTCLRDFLTFNLATALPTAQGRMQFPALQPLLLMFRKLHDDLDAFVSSRLGALLVIRLLLSPPKQKHRRRSSCRVLAPQKQVLLECPFRFTHAHINRPLGKV